MTSQEETVSLLDVIAPSFNDAFWDIFDNKYSHYWFKGGRGSTKSSFVAVEIILGIMDDGKNGIMSNAVALRKVKDTLKDSVYEQLCWAIDILNVDKYWDKKVSPMSLTYIPTGQKILFRGADKPKKIKSTKFRKGFCKYIWFEEVDEFEGMVPIRVILQSLMRGGDDSICFYSYNPPKSSGNWANMECKKTRADRLVHHSTYLEVPKEWLGNQFIVEAEHLKQTNELAYRHEYLGEEVGTGGEIFHNVTIRPITDDEIAGFDHLKRGVDFGYAIDPCHYGTMHFDRKRKRLYIFHELHEVGLSNEKLIRHIKTENKSNKAVTADSAEPKSIGEMLQNGLRVFPAKKGPDSIDYGIKFLVDLEEIIIDDERCPNTAREFLGYELEQDANGNWKSEYPDKNNHSIDMCRYALEDEIIAGFRYKEPKKPEQSPFPETSMEHKIQKKMEQVIKSKGKKKTKGWYF
jgi:PBSX family phage terminase large subunit